MMIAIPFFEEASDQTYETLWHQYIREAGHDAVAGVPVDILRVGWRRWWDGEVRYLVRAMGEVVDRDVSRRT